MPEEVIDPGKVSARRFLASLKRLSLRSVGSTLLGLSVATWWKILGFVFVVATALGAWWQSGRPVDAPLKTVPSRSLVEVFGPMRRLPTIEGTLAARRSEFGLENLPDSLSGRTLADLPDGYFATISDIVSPQSHTKILSAPSSLQTFEVWRRRRRVFLVGFVSADDLKQKPGDEVAVAARPTIGLGNVTELDLAVFEVVGRREVLNFWGDEEIAVIDLRRLEPKADSATVLPERADPAVRHSSGRMPVHSEGSRNEGLEAVADATPGVDPMDVRADADAVIDSNVVVQLYSCHDLVNVFDLAHGQVGDAAASHPDVVARVERLRDALFFAIRCHEEGTRTIGLLEEPLTILERNVPPESETFERFFIAFVLHYVRDKVLDGWQLLGWTPAQPVKADKADDELLELAARSGLPLITDEGNGPGGLSDTKNGKLNLRGKAKARGVPVYTPGEWWRRPGFDADAAAIRFTERANAGRPEYIKNHPSREKVAPVVNQAAVIYNIILNRKFG